ncbi:MAG TPA: hypothetical protein RMH85_12455 [Polyangiaceae bacterium LLY-WYZ-15_(1-7)]|nr:hypothetical protein [Myxococcales bacterium]MAT25917.1 hypothetical protein [Sandaracinus sp.]HJL02278.1 hypothetical protein [Polyangiaceae bacterium LLY-WYZ-15_(1-7)]MBJ71308.1 hypothetical protein [Sandaracinus sp.]HJL09308.1 hypothetical protein [Polyangiaceae bacterium LLY-WYZ-15_(1-7)]
MPALRPTSLALAPLAAALLVACTDTQLFRDDGTLYEADRLTLRGRVCAEDTRQATLPTRVVLIVDQATGPLFADYDPGATRVPLLRSFIQSRLADPDVSFAVVGYGGLATIHAPTEGDFTRNLGELLNAVDLLSLPEPCAADDLCRDPVAALRSARALIEGDLANTPPGERVLTQYQVLWVPAGPPAPLAPAALCCAPDDTACRAAGDAPSAECQAQLELETATDLLGAVHRLGALGAKLHVMHLAADAPEVNDALEARFGDLTFAVGGTYQRFATPAAFDGRAFDVLSERPTLRAKTLLVANQNALPTGEGVAVDSDADGLSDAQEAAFGTSPGDPDTDGDGVSDLVEVLVDFDPLTPEEPIACRRVEPGDTDLDGLSDCDEAVLGTEPTLVDTDGDGLPDPLEVLGFVDYLHADAEDDADGDGVANGDEIRMRMHPRSGDTGLHLAEGYRYEVEDEGVVRELFAESPRRLDAVQTLEVGPDTTPGRGTILFRADGTLAWQDPGDSEPGEPVAIVPPMASPDEEVELVLWAAESAPPVPDAEGNVPDPAPGSWIRVRVQPWLLPPAEVVEALPVAYRERHCLQYTVRNVRLLPTAGYDDGRDVGTNRILLFFAETPAGAPPTAPGPVRIAEIPVFFEPPARRFPDGPVLEVLDDEFVRR